MSRFDPTAVAARLGKRQRQVILSLSEDWGKASSHECAKRLWYGSHHLIDHKHMTDNCWRLNDRGSAVRAILARAA